MQIIDTEEYPTKVWRVAAHIPNDELIKIAHEYYTFMDESTPEQRKAMEHILGAVHNLLTHTLHSHDQEVNPEPPKLRRVPIGELELGQAFSYTSFIDGELKTIHGVIDTRSLGTSEATVNGAVTGRLYFGNSFKVVPE